MSEKFDVKPSSERPGLVSVGIGGESFMLESGDAMRLAEQLRAASRAAATMAVAFAMSKREGSGS